MMSFLDLARETGIQAGRHRRISRMAQFLLLLTGFFLTLCAGCLETGETTNSEAIVYGRKGFDPGRFIRPRAITIDPATDEIYVVDMTGRIQVFDREGKFLRGWRTPDCRQGRPVGLSFSNDGRLMVSDTHYYQVLFYTPAGELLSERTIGGMNGRGQGEFGFVTDVAQDSKGNYYVGEYGDYDRIQKFDPQGKYLTEFGSHGTEPGSFLRPQSLAIDAQDHLWVADVSNHRIQVFDVSGEVPTFDRVWGEQGAEAGKLSYPNSIWIDNHSEGRVWICDMGNHRIQSFTKAGKWLGSWGGPGRDPGQMYQPWAMVRDSQGAFHVVDTYNHRVQRLEPKLENSSTRN